MWFLMWKVLYSFVLQDYDATTAALRVCSTHTSLYLVELSWLTMTQPGVCGDPDKSALVNSLSHRLTRASYENLLTAEC